MKKGYQITGNLFSTLRGMVVGDEYRFVWYDD